MEDDSEQGLLSMTVPSVWKTKRGKPKTLADELGAFEEFGKETIVLHNQIANHSVPVFINEFWTSGQRQANKLHEISYRACFKPQLPKFFIDRLTELVGRERVERVPGCVDHVTRGGIDEELAEPSGISRSKS